MISRESRMDVDPKTEEDPCGERLRPICGSTTNDRNPPVPAADLKAAVITLGQLIGANDGGKKAVTAKKRQHQIVVRMMEQDAHYVEQVANNDPAIIAKAGFQTIAPKTPPQPLDQPKIEKVVPGMTGQMLVSVTPDPKARMFEVHVGVTGPGGALPTTWMNVPLPK